MMCTKIYLFDLNFVINGKGMFLHKENKYVKRRKNSFDNFSALCNFKLLKICSI